MLYKTRCKYLQRFAVLLRSQGLTHVRSTEAVLAADGLVKHLPYPAF